MKQGEKKPPLHQPFKAADFAKLIASSKPSNFDPKKFAVALGMCRICVDDMTAEIIFETYKKVIELGGDFSLRDSSKIVCAMQDKYKKKEKVKDGKRKK